MTNGKPKLSINVVQLGIVLAAHLCASIWLVSSMASDVRYTKERVLAIGAEQLKRSENVWRSKARLDALRRDIDRLEVRIDRLEQR